MVYLTKPSATSRLPLRGKLSGGYKVFFLIFFLIVIEKTAVDKAPAVFCLPEKKNLAEKQGEGCNSMPARVVAVSFRHAAHCFCHTLLMY